MRVQALLFAPPLTTKRQKTSPCKSTTLNDATEAFDQVKAESRRYANRFMGAKKKSDLELILGQGTAECGGC